MEKFKFDLTEEELQKKFLDFYKKHGHAEVANAPLIPENDPSVLFTTAGMHPLVPYLLGEKHPLGTRLVNIQKCLRTVDFDIVGDNTHNTMFEMLGVWSLGDYFKKESIEMTVKFLVGELKIPQNRLYATMYIGDDVIGKDLETYEIWKKQGFRDDQLYFYDAGDNWWGMETGPCGPCSEVYFDTGKKGCGEKTCGPACDCGKYVEIWNNVFMQYNKGSDGKFTPLEKPNVDTGVGFERLFSTLNGVESVYETRKFVNMIKNIEKITGKKYEDHKKAFRVLTDHVRSATFILGDPRGVTPSNTDQGYVLRRFIRKTFRYLKQLGAENTVILDIAKSVIENYKESYPVLKEKEKFIIEQIVNEEKVYSKTVTAGYKELEKVLAGLKKGEVLSGEAVFRLFETYGFPVDLTLEICLEREIKVDEKGVEEKRLEHQQKSRLGSEQKFKGGLADCGEATTKLHTATHLMQAALRKVLGNDVLQKGSNITAERLRFDFSFGRKMEDAEIKKVEELVNEAIGRKFDVVCEEMTVEAAKKKGAIGLFPEKYCDIVKVYIVGDFSSELCGGPHVKNTGELGRFKIQKEEASSAGVRRIKAVLV